MSATTVKRLAADILKCGVNRIRIKDGEYGRAMEALTREDVRGLIDDGAVYSLRYVGPRTKPERKRKGIGKRRGKKFSRKSEKDSWMERIRSQRAYLDVLLETGEVPAEYKRKVYLKIKGGSFKGKKALLTYLKENEMYDESKKKAAPAKKEAAKAAEPKKEAPKKEKKAPVKKAAPKKK